MTFMLALLPLDDRPPTLLFPQRIAAIAGIDLVVPPRELLGNFLQPGNSYALCQWLSEQARQVEGMLVAADMLAYGGLVASRSPAMSLNDALNQLEILHAAKQSNPQVQILAASVIMRISITASDAQAASYYRSLIRYSELTWLVESEGRRDLQPEFQKLKTRLPPEVLQGYLDARQRNHMVNRRMVEMLAEGILDELILIQEDASLAGPHLMEQKQLWGLAETLGVKDRIQIYPGADEGTQTLLARWINRVRPPRIRAVYTSEPGADKTAPFEDRPLRKTVENHLKAAGCQPGGQSNADGILWVHTPCATKDIQKAVDEIGELLKAGKQVGVADVRFPNGSDPELMEALCQRGLLPKLAAYAGWNTAGNTMGTTIAHLCAWLAAQRNIVSPAQLQAQQLFLWERIVDDWGYQRLLRDEIEKELRQIGIDPLSLGKDKENVQAEVARKLGEWAEDTFERSAWPSRVPVLQIRLPWPRTFEVEIHARPAG